MLGAIVRFRNVDTMQYERSEFLKLLAFKEIRMKLEELSFKLLAFKKKKKSTRSEATSSFRRNEMTTRSHKKFPIWNTISGIDS
jgi:hypothetical protein